MNAPRPDRFEKRGVIRLSLDYDEHPKVSGLSDSQFRAHVEMLILAGRLKTDGVILAGAAHRRWGKRTVMALVRAGLVNEVESDKGPAYELHDWSRWQWTRAELDEYKAERAQSGARGGHVKNHVNKGVNSPSCELCLVENPVVTPIFRGGAR